MSGPDRVYDSGLQLERTTLAWDRTSLAFLANGLLVVRLAGDATAIRALGFLVVVLGALPMIAGRRRYVRRDAALRQGRSPLSTTPIALVGIAAIVTSLIALTATLASLP